MAPFLKCSIFSFLCFLSSIHLSAQYITVPDPNLRGWFFSHGLTQCFNGVNLDTTCPLLSSVRSANIAGDMISDLQGIEYLVNLDTLFCQNNDIAIVKALPPNLKYFDGNKNNFSKITNLPLSLTYLDCSYNPLDSLALPALPNNLRYLNINFCYGVSVLPPLPDSLRYLECSTNLLTSLPDLPAKLISMDCSYNKLDSIPSLPDSLRYLDCGTNKLFNLPQLPVALQELYCRKNEISFLPLLPNSLRILVCEYNQIGNLPILPSGIEMIYGSENLLTELPALPSFLKILHVAGNQLSSLPILPNRLIEFNCARNNLSAIPNLSDSLTRFWCSNNHLASLPGSAFPTSLTLLYCNSNEITSLHALPKTLSILYCNNNKLTTIPEIPDSMLYLDVSYNPDLHCFPLIKKIEWLNLVGTGIECLSNYGTVLSSNPPVLSFPICDSTNNNFECLIYTKVPSQVTSSEIISIFPNPFLSNFSIALEKEGISEAVFTVSNAMGQVVYHRKETNLAQGYTKNLDLSFLPNGIYFIEVSSPSNMQGGEPLREVKRVVKE